METGERVVAYFDHVGGIEGTVVREFEGGFAFKLAATQHKREKLAAQLTWLANRRELGGAEERRHERIAPKGARQTLQLAEGIVLACQVLDISVSGASIGDTPARPEIGTEVMLGTSCAPASCAITRKASACSSSTCRTSGASAAISAELRR